VPVELEKGTQRESQGNHSATKGHLVSIFGGNFFVLRWKLQEALNKKSRDLNNAYCLTVLGRLH
jgi:hypothetical protein